MLTMVQRRPAVYPRLGYYVRDNANESSSQSTDTCLSGFHVAIRPSTINPIDVDVEVMLYVSRIYLRYNYKANFVNG